jgi:hypothetical protein
MKNSELKIMWEIRPTSGKYDCFLGPIVSYAESFKIDYEVGLLTGWGFYCSQDSYVPKHNGIGLINILEKIHGIFLDRCTFKNEYELIKLLTEKLPKSPVMISVDAIDCPWCLTYKKYNMFHYILVLGIQEETLYCVDSYFASNGILQWNISQKSWAGECIDFRVEKVNPKKEDYLSYINNAIDYVKKSNMICELKKYRDILVTKDSFAEEIYFYNNDYYAMPIFISLQHIYMRRYNNATAIKYIGKKLSEEDFFCEAADAFVKSGHCYEAMKSILIKQIITNRIIPSKIQESMNKIIEAESSTLEIMERITNIIT